jgi:hypothetical protein
VTSPPTIAPIVEGHGEVKAVPELISRIGLEFLGEWVKVAQPFRVDSGRMRHPHELARAIRVQATRVQGRGGVLVLRDGDDSDVNCPVELAKALHPGHELVPVPIEIVVAFHEYEAWFLAAVDSLASHSAVQDDAKPPASPEGKRNAKKELELMMHESYHETRHQVKFSAIMDLKAAERNSRSFRRMVHAVRLLASSTAR